MYLEHSRYCSFIRSFLSIHSFNTYSRYAYGLPRWLSGKESAHNEGELGFIPGLGRSPGEEDGNPLQYSCLKNPMDRGASLAIILGVAKVQHNLVTRQINKKKRYGTEQTKQIMSFLSWNLQCSDGISQ